MSINKEIKKNICNQILQILNQKIDIATTAINSAKESRNNDTKSSAGDKYETGREMMQIEIEKNEVQLNKILAQKRELSAIDLVKSHSKVEFGSLIQTNLGTYFVSIGLGKIIVNEKVYYSISIASPIGKAFKDRIKDDRIQFQKREYTIENLF